MSVNVILIECDNCNGGRWGITARESLKKEEGQWAAICPKGVICLRGKKEKPKGGFT